MTPSDVPLLGAVLDSGPDDPVFDALLLAGPVVILLVALLGRRVPSVALAASYLAAVCSYVLYRWVVREESDRVRR